MSLCNRCDRPIRWVKSDDAWLPIDPDPTPGGTLPGNDGLMYHHHRETCPAARHWRRRTKKGSTT